MRIRDVLGLIALLLGLAGVAEAAPPLVDSAWLKSRLGMPGVVVLDLQQRSGYLRAHIPGAVNSSYNDWRAVGKNRIPKVIPPPERLEKLIGGLGIDNQTHVILVATGRSASDMAMATRLYWTFKTLGHKEVSILDGGLMGYAYNRKNRLESEENRPEPKSYTARFNSGFVPAAGEVKQAIEIGMALIDNRSRAEFLGIYRGGRKERPGTIATAVNLPFDWLTINGGGWFQEPEAIKQIYAASGVPVKGEQISFCHTGHRTSLVWFVSHELLGNKQARMYDGSIVEWAVDPSLHMDLAVKLD